MMLLLLAVASTVFAQSEAERMIATFKVPDGFKVKLFAAEPMVANPVAFCVDEKGRVYVAETFRQKKGVDDNRSRMFWLNDDLASQTVEDRLVMYKKWAHKVPMTHYTTHEDRIRLLEDTNNDGRADKATVFADKFNGALDGTGAGVIAMNGDVYFTCIPHLWKLRDNDGDGIAEMRESLANGFGVRVALRGHDMHGLTWGPDGRLYFSIGDRGFMVKTKEGKVLHRPGSGAVFRCEPDGSNLEVFAWSLRNPQELAFDKYGNLWTGDNNSDAGDEARLVYVVEGGESGWHMSYQTLTGDYSRGPWHMEKIWHTQESGGEDQPAWTLPPIAHLFSGPSGMTYNSGIGLPDKYDNYFFLCDFRGGASRSGVQTWTVKQRGAGFEMVDHHAFMEGVLATDVDFGYDGKMYVSDWIAGWDGINKGRMYTVEHEQAIKNEAIARTANLLREGFGQRDGNELAKLLSHADMRVRLRAQFALAKLGKEGFNPLYQASNIKNPSQPGRIHAIWGLGQIARTHNSNGALCVLEGRLKDEDAEIRAQAARMIADVGRVRHELVAERLITLLFDESLRVRFFAAKALGKIKHKEGIEAILQMIRENNDKDRFLRHAGVLALYSMGDADAVFAHADDKSPAARMAVLLAMRRFNDARIAHILNDVEQRLVTEAARAIHDLPIEEGMIDLAKLIGNSTHGSNEPLMRRVISANSKLGRAENASAVAAYAAQSLHPEKLRLEALAALNDWATPSQRDRVLGYWRPLPNRDPAIVRMALEPRLAALLSSESQKIARKTTRIAARFDLKVDLKTFVEWADDSSKPVETRIEALRLLVGRKHPDARKLVMRFVDEKDPLLRAEGRNQLVELDPDAAAMALNRALDDGTIPEKQMAYASLAKLATPKADRALLDAMKRLIDGKLPPETQLDVIMAADSRKSNKQLAAGLAQYESTLSKSDPLAAFRVSLVGGNHDAGHSVYFGRQATQCYRCHNIEGDGSATAGPDLTAYGKKHTREHILESIINPNAKMAEGYATTIIITKEDSRYTGIVRGETDTHVVFDATSVEEPDDLFDDEVDEEQQASVGNPRTVKIAKSDILKRMQGLSPMPQDISKTLNKRDLRDLVELIFTNKPKDDHGR